MQQDEESQKEKAAAALLSRERPDLGCVSGSPFRSPAVDPSYADIYVHLYLVQHQYVSEHPNRCESIYVPL